MTILTYVIIIILDELTFNIEQKSMILLLHKKKASEIFKNWERNRE